MSRMPQQFDVIVIGLGAMGSAALYQLSRRGLRILGIDRFHPPHHHGSSHGDTRITRLALGEGARYVQFVRRSHEIWRELEGATGRSLLRSVGGLIYGSTTGRARAHGASDFLQTTIDVARHHGISHEVLEIPALRERFPQFIWRGDEFGYFEHDAGFVHPEACIAAQLEESSRLGATIQTGEQVINWRAVGSGVQLTTDRSAYEAARLILCTGPWLPKLMPQLGRRAKVYRQVLFWFQPEGPQDMFNSDRMPVYIRVPDAGTAMFYGFPAINGPGGGFKIAGEQFDQPIAPDETERIVGDEEIAGMHALASPHLRMSFHCVRTAVCKYTVTPDFHFVIDHAPDSDRVWFASACSGHGFKHSAAIGEALAERTIDGRSQFDLSAFRLNRFDPNPTTQDDDCREP
ncbi:MAG: N-methyl-L-tryptophan oxidase [Opitutaceae bacterium]|nr:N-methyl-L-tryptophan oxidase [Verrucomicrobiales bacterium]